MKASRWAVLLSISLLSSLAEAQTRMDLWRDPSYFRGFVISPNVPISEQDIADVRSAGATLVCLATDGFWAPASPYTVNQQNIQALDTRIGYCDAVGIHYVIAVRQGPGRYDVADEGTGLDPPSTIWKDSIQQALYGEMLRVITARYIDDPLFAGITPTVEPDPFFDSLCCIDTAQFDYYFTRNDVNFDAITQLWVDSIRAASADIPILIQGPGYSNPIVFSLVPIIHDPNIVYEFHNYHPIQFTEAADTASVSYPGTYLDAINGIPLLASFDKTFLEDTLLEDVSQVAERTNAPIFLGEFGITYPHTGGPQYLDDMSSIALANGWHFAYFDYWHRPNGEGPWDYRDWDPAYWDTILQSFQTPSPALVQTAARPDNDLTIIQTAEDELLVEWSVPNIPVHFTIEDILGRPVESCYRMSGNFTIRTPELAPGIYALVVSSGAYHASKLFSTLH